MTGPRLVVSKLVGLKNEAKRGGWLQWIRGPADERALLAGCRFDPAAADHVVEFFRQFLRHSKGQWSGQPFELLDWQRVEVIAPLFGWKDADGFRRFRRSYIELPKKNGKSTLASGIGLYMLAGDGEPGAEVYSAATDKEQAGIVHKEAMNMVDASAELSGALKVNRSTKNIEYPAQLSFYRALSSEADGKEGLNIHCVIIDELHVWRGRELWDALKYGMASRRQPLTFCITTAGDDLQSVCYEQHQYAEGVIKGAIHDDRFFGLIKAAAADDDWLAPETWAKANPSLGITIRESDFAADAQEAAKLPRTVTAFKRYRLNVWSSGTTPWLDVSKWGGCRKEVTAEDLVGRPCYAGLDLAKTLDTTSLQLVFPMDGEIVRLQSYFWLPKATADEMEGRVGYLAWGAAGLITLTDGDVCDYEAVKLGILAVAEQFQLLELAYDPWQAEHLIQDLVRDRGLKCTAFPQKIGNFAGPTGEFERRVLNGTLEHGGHAVMDWQIGNVQVHTDANGNKRPVKPKPHDWRKIDGPVAAIMALGIMLKGEGDDTGPSPYDSDGGGEVYC